MKAKQVTGCCRLSAFLVMAFIFIAAGLLLAQCSSKKESELPVEIPRISVQDAQQNVLSGESLIVCAYDDEQCKQVRIEGALLLSEFRAQMNSVPKDREIIFYCA